MRHLLLLVSLLMVAQSLHGETEWSYGESPSFTLRGRSADGDILITINGKGSVVVANVPAASDFDYAATSASVTVQIDASQSAERWRVKPGGGLGTFEAPDPIAFARRLLRGTTTLKLRIQPPAKPSVVAEFELTKLASVAPQLSKGFEKAALAPATSPKPLLLR